jgi:hypothetical protein
MMTRLSILEAMLDSASSNTEKIYRRSPGWVTLRQLGHLSRHDVHGAGHKRFRKLGCNITAVHWLCTAAGNVR